MNEPAWIEEDVVLAIHLELLARFGGGAGLRDAGALDAVINRPRTAFHYGETSLFRLAALYAEGIVISHPFLDGNKRTGFMTAYTFLGMNGYRFNAPEPEAVLLTLDLAKGEINAAAYAVWLERSC
jgi:death-on-curing protein